MSKVRTFALVNAVIAVMAVIAWSGCNGGGGNGGNNQAPVAQAGNNQTVQSGATVQLNGSDSSDADGDTLTFAWTRTDNGPVQINLAGQNTVNASFVAPAVNGPTTLTFELRVTDGNGGEDTDTVNVTVELVPTLNEFLVVETDGEGVVGLNDPASLDGQTVLVDTSISNTLGGVQDIAVDSQNHLFIALKNDNSIVVYENAVTSTDPELALRTISGDATDLHFPQAIAIDKTTDTLYVANDPLNFRADIRIYDNVDDQAFNGDVAPSRRFHTAADTAFHPLQLLVHNGDLWVVDDRDGDTKTSILVFEDVASIPDDSEAAPNRTIFTTHLGDPIAIFVDNQNRLFAVDQTNKVIFWNNADTVNGEDDGSVEFFVNPAQRLNHIVVDDNDTMFLADGFNVIYAIDNVGEIVSGAAVDPDRTIEGNDISSPDKLELIQP